MRADVTIAHAYRDGAALLYDSGSLVIGTPAAKFPVLGAKENAAARIGMIFDPLDPAAASEKLLYGFLHPLGFVRQ